MELGTVLDTKDKQGNKATKNFCLSGVSVTIGAKINKLGKCEICQMVRKAMKEYKLENLLTFINL